MLSRHLSNLSPTQRETEIFHQYSGSVHQPHEWAPRNSILQPQSSPRITQPQLQSRLLCHDKNQLSHFQTPDPQKLWVVINVDCSFKSLNFGTICYIATADKYSRFAKEHVTWFLYHKPSRKEVCPTWIFILDQHILSPDFTTSFCSVLWNILELS